ncbi:MAG TPA: hypothetical protein VGQ19_10565 [Burkholderiales bacterium]|jgi:hypothetical protein|nr:hypothetical protein [Burkholderiales bacterium]
MSERFTKADFTRLIRRGYASSDQPFGKEVATLLAWAGWFVSWMDVGDETRFTSLKRKMRERRPFNSADQEQIITFFSGSDRYSPAHGLVVYAMRQMQQEIDKLRKQLVDGEGHRMAARKGHPSTASPSTSEREGAGHERGAGNGQSSCASPSHSPEDDAGQRDHAGNGHLPLAPSSSPLRDEPAISKPQRPMPGLGARFKKKPNRSKWGTARDIQGAVSKNLRDSMLWVINGEGRPMPLRKAGYTELASYAKQGGAVAIICKQVHFRHQRNPNRFKLSVEQLEPDIDGMEKRAIEAADRDFKRSAA